ncbi:hypothetical protein [Shinella zoogloeoides]|uniref:hypothetical protein n=1 Tax=Shinella zoogloeoides TaxID=352475 RepID=UPI0028B1F6C0|nr:hypothetical protein [Shinella zoogloeoides]
MAAIPNLTYEMLKSLLPDEGASLEVKRVSIRNLPDAERKAYKAKKQAESRAALKERKAEGSVKFNAASARDALADAALMLLASDAPGSQAVEAYLRQVFADQPGAPLTIKARAKSGQMKPKLLQFTGGTRR